MNFFLLLLLLPLHPVAEYSIVFVMFVLLQILKVDAYTNTNTCMYVCLYIIYNCLGVCVQTFIHTFQLRTYTFTKPKYNQPRQNKMQKQNKCQTKAHTNRRARQSTIIAGWQLFHFRNFNFVLIHT